MKCIIVDDERHARENLIYLLEQQSYDLEVIGEAESVDEAHKLILALNPDIVFLDITMPGKSGFDLLDMFEKILFDIVFVTAYDKYAMQAFEKLATAYLLKPVDEAIFASNIEKIHRLRNSNEFVDYKSIKQLLSNVNTASRLGVPTEKGIDLVSKADIIYLESNEGYTIIHFKDKTKKFTSKRLSYFLDRLMEDNFMKIHQSYIVNLNEAVGYRKNGILTLSNSIELPVSRTMRKAIYSHLTGN